MELLRITLNTRNQKELVVLGDSHVQIWKRGVKQASFNFISIKDFLTEDTQLPRKIWYFLISGNFVGYDDALPHHNIFYKKINEKPFVVFEKQPVRRMDPCPERVCFGHTAWETIVTNKTNILDALIAGLPPTITPPSIELLLRGCYPSSVRYFGRRRGPWDKM